MNTKNQTFPTALNVAEKLKSAGLAEIRNIRNSHLPEAENEHTEYAIPASIFSSVAEIEKEIQEFLEEKTEEVQSLVDSTLDKANSALSEKDMETPFLSPTITSPAVSLKSEIVGSFQEAAIIAWYAREEIKRPVKEASTASSASTDLGFSF